MRPRNGSSLAAFLLFVPLLAVPLLAIFGVPEFSSVSASPGGESAHRLAPTRIESRVGESARYTVDDLFAPYLRNGRSGDESAGDRSESPRASTAANRSDALHSAETPQRLDAETSGPPSGGPPAGNALATRRDDWTPPPGALRGWELDDGPRGESLFPEPAPREDVRESREPVPFAASGRNDAAESPSRGPTPDDRRLLARAETRADARLDERFPVRTDVRTESRTAPLTESRSDPRAHSPTAELRNEPLAEMQPLTWGAAVDRLNALGINEFRLSPGNGTDCFHFSCSYTPPDNPRITHRFEDEAAEPLRAVEKVLAQIDQWRQRSSTDGRQAGVERRR